MKVKMISQSAGSLIGPFVNLNLPVLRGFLNDLVPSTFIEH